LGNITDLCKTVLKTRRIEERTNCQLPSPAIAFLITIALAKVIAAAGTKNKGVACGPRWETRPDEYRDHTPSWPYAQAGIRFHH